MAFPSRASSCHSYRYSHQLEMGPSRRWKDGGQGRIRGERWCFSSLRGSTIPSVGPALGSLVFILQRMIKMD